MGRAPKPAAPTLFLRGEDRSSGVRPEVCVLLARRGGSPPWEFCERHSSLTRWVVRQGHASYMRLAGCKSSCGPGLSRARLGLVQKVLSKPTSLPTLPTSCGAGSKHRVRCSAGGTHQVERSTRQDAPDNDGTSPSLHQPNGEGDQAARPRPDHAPQHQVEQQCCNLFVGHVRSGGGTRENGGGPPLQRWQRDGRGPFKGGRGGREGVAKEAGKGRRASTRSWAGTVR